MPCDIHRAPTESSPGPQTTTLTWQQGVIKKYSDLRGLKEIKHSRRSRKKCRWKSVHHRGASCSFQGSYNNQLGNNSAPFAISTCEFVTKQFLIHPMTSLQKDLQNCVIPCQTKPFTELIRIPVII